MRPSRKFPIFRPPRRESRILAQWPRPPKFRTFVYRGRKYPLPKGMTPVGARWLTTKNKVRLNVAKTMLGLAFGLRRKGYKDMAARLGLLAFDIGGPRLRRQLYGQKRIEFKPLTEPRGSQGHEWLRAQFNELTGKITIDSKVIEREVKGIKALNEVVDFIESKFAADEAELAELVKKGELSEREAAERLEPTKRLIDGLIKAEAALIVEESARKKFFGTALRHEEGHKKTAVRYGIRYLRGKLPQYRPKDLVKREVVAYAYAEPQAFEPKVSFWVLRKTIRNQLDKQLRGKKLGLSPKEKEEILKYLDKELLRARSLILKGASPERVMKEIMEGR